MSLRKVWMMCSCILLMWGLSLAADEMPTIQFERYFGDPPRHRGSAVPVHTLVATFPRILGKNQGEILQILDIPGDPRTTFTIQHLEKAQHLLIVDSFEDPAAQTAFIYRAIYPLNGDRSIGYCLFDYMDFGKRFQNDPVILQIKNLAKNQNYLQGEFVIPENSTLTIYEAPHTDYIERYAIFEMVEGEKALMLDAFYPKDLEETLKPYVLLALNQNMKEFARYERL